MSSSGLSYGLNITKKQSSGSKPAPAKRKTIFDVSDDSGGEDSQSACVEAIGEIGGLDFHLNGKLSSTTKSKLLPGAKSKLRTGESKNVAISVYGDLSTSFSSKKHASTAEELDATIYDYDAVYESLKPQKNATVEDQERKSKYMANLLAAAAVRKRDAAIAEDKKLAREREAEGEEFAEKEKFVTSAYKKQQAENRRLEEEERVREQQEQKNEGTGMTGFYKNMLEKGEQKHAEVMKAAEEKAKAGLVMEEEQREKMRTEADVAKEINEKRAGAIIVNDEGQVVDKRQLLKGGLNIAAKPKSTTSTSSRGGSAVNGQSRVSGFVGMEGGKQAMRERQSRMVEMQLEQATKRALEGEEEEREKVERTVKSRKTEGEIIGAKERYLARKREAEEAKKRGGAG